MRSRYVLIALVLVALGFGGGRLSAAVGTLDSPDVPGNTWSFTLEDIYNRLNDGTAGAQSTFTEPAAGPGTGTMHDLNQIMAQAPAIDNTNGATETNVLDGKTFWGLTGGQWGTQPGTMPDNGAVTIVPTTTNQTIALGYHNGSGKVEGDADLVAGKIKSSVDLFGVTGTVIEATGNATAANVLTGKTFSNAGAAGIAGTMPDNEGDNASTAQARPGTVSYFTAPEGYYDGDDRVSATDAQVAALDADITGGKIKSGENIFGVAGNLTPGGTAIAADLFNGKTAHLASDWTLDSGTLDLACNTVTFDGAGNLVATAYDGAAGDGSNRWCMTDSGDAAAGDILQGKKAWVDGSEVTGDVAAGSNVSGSEGAKTFTIPDGLYSGSKTCTANDAQLVAGNIKSGVDIFGVTGSYAGTACTGDATTTDVLYPKTFSNSSATGLTGELHGGCTCCSTCTLHASRWCDNGNGTVTDLTTCLVWLKKADWGGVKAWRCESAYAWCSDDHDDAHTRAGILKAADHAWLSDGSVEGDWRLPTKTELDGLVNGAPNLRCSSGPCNLHAFTGVQSSGYWSSTTYAPNTTFAWFVLLNGGFVFIVNKDNYYYVWPVRGGQ